MNNFHTLEEFYINYYDKNSRKMKFTGSTEDELVEWQKTARAKLFETTGLSALRAYFTELGFSGFETEIAEEVIKDGFIRRKVYLKIENDITVPLYLFVPENMNPDVKYPVILAPHGHGSNGKESPAGIRDNPKVAESIDIHDYNYGEYYAKRDCIVFCPDAPGFGEMREANIQSDDCVMNSSCEILNHILIPLGLSVNAIWTYCLMRIIDYAMTMPNADAERIYCLGLSGGGLQTLYLAACDERVKKAVTSGYFYGVKQALVYGAGNCSCNFSYEMWVNFDMGDIACLIFPRWFKVETGDIDPLNGMDGLDNVRSQIDIVRRAYALAGLENRVVHSICPGPHKWYGTGTDEFLGL